MNYGIPYMGSKNAIAEWVVAHLPPADVLIDAFAGGCAVTHAALMSGKYKHIIANDVSDAPQLFLDAIHGKYRGNGEWISREKFHLRKDSDPYIRYCWSFGNKGDKYMYSRDIEAYKHAMHRLAFADNPRQRMLAYKRCLREFLNLAKAPAHPAELQSLESLQRLERLQSLEVVRGDYRDIPIPENAVVYCDPPYRGTEKYNGGQDFDHDAFHAWLRRLAVPCVISEYSMPDDFRIIASRRKTSNLGATSYAIENLYAVNYSPLTQGELGL